MRQMQLFGCAREILMAGSRFEEADPAQPMHRWHADQSVFLTELAQYTSLSVPISAGHNDVDSLPCAKPSSTKTD
ncbi:hypothetical protein [Cupriavidus pauculus]|uniref:hypothetical protein n=1 Tax=Cupriavidus pauculus TaxID=82633 RepID=UPI00147907B5|nr:hypothetical protein [Cupriavidus pauculus]MCM3607524.1 hypothetical protein [Cupriavidus pauculus]UAL03717.1 hypothetical protein K8O84_23460 [Cupriavidus pauculus]